ncbi:MAG: ATP synthase F1 subunit epsilon [Acidimicrobiia bacterium]
MTLQVELVSPEGILYEGEAQMVICRTVEGGDIAFLTGHVPFVGSLAVGLVKIIGTGDQTTLLAVHRGFVSVANDRVTILSDVAELATEIDVARAEAAKTRAEESLRAASDDDEARAALRRADVRLLAARG